MKPNDLFDSLRAIANSIRGIELGINQDDRVGQLSDLETSATTNIVAAINSLKSAVDAIDDRVTTLESTVDTLDDKVTALESAVDAIDDRVTALEETEEATE